MRSLIDIPTDAHSTADAFVSMSIGFTGTRQGMTSVQLEACRALLLRLSPRECHHGDAIGADAQAHEIALAQKVRIIVHPPSRSSSRAFCSGDESRDELPYMARNRAIVDETDLLIAAPAGPAADAPHSGTWRTVRYAQRIGRPVVIIHPTGEYSHLNPDQS